MFEIIEKTNGKKEKDSIYKLVNDADKKKLLLFDFRTCCRNCLYGFRVSFIPFRYSGGHRLDHKAVWP